MSDDSTMFSTGSLQTFIAGAFIIALLALGMSIYNYSRTTAAVSALLDLQSVATSVATADDGSGAALTDLQTKVDALAVQVKKLEESAAQAAAALPAPE
ncbi:MAG: hypothetical protein JRI25_01440 [Deltaproteobacteria bacterium]|nr:hypothetical protein [Deltaproteobacteria bacterium]